MKQDIRKGKKKKVADAPNVATVTWFTGIVKEAGRKAAENKAQRLARGDSGGQQSSQLNLPCTCRARKAATPGVFQHHPSE